MHLRHLMTAYALILAGLAAVGFVARRRKG